MAKDYSQQLSSIMVTLANINDHLRSIDTSLQVLSKDSKNDVQKHIVVVKHQPKKKEKGNE